MFDTKRENPAKRPKNKNMLRAKIEDGRGRGICRNGQTYAMISVEHTVKSWFLCLLYIECIDQ